MVGDKLHINQEYLGLTNDLIIHLNEKNLLDRNKLVIGVGGESGSGKSVTATCLHDELSNRNINCLLLGMDDYFKLPAADNHKNRQKSFDNVGTHEVKLDLLEKHITDFKNGISKITAPLSDFEGNKITSREIEFGQTQVLIVEGTYVLSLPNLDYRIFLERDYTQTLADRIKRGRESFDPFVEQVLNIEHGIVSKYINVADIVIDNSFCIKS